MKASESLSRRLLRQEIISRWPTEARRWDEMHFSRIEHLVWTKPARHPMNCSSRLKRKGAEFISLSEQRARVAPGFGTGPKEFFLVLILARAFCSGRHSIAFGLQAPW